MSGSSAGRLQGGSKMRTPSLPARTSFNEDTTRSSRVRSLRRGERPTRSQAQGAATTIRSMRPSPSLSSAPRKTCSCQPGLAGSPFISCPENSRGTAPSLSRESAIRARRTARSRSGAAAVGIHVSRGSAKTITSRRLSFAGAIRPRPRYRPSPMTSGPRTGVAKRISTCHSRSFVKRLPRAKTSALAPFASNGSRCTRIESICASTRACRSAWRTAVAARASSAPRSTAPLASSALPRGSIRRRAIRSGSAIGVTVRHR